MAAGMWTVFLLWFPSTCALVSKFLTTDVVLVYVLYMWWCCPHINRCYVSARTQAGLWNCDLTLAKVSYTSWLLHNLLAQYLLIFTGLPSKNLIWVFLCALQGYRDRYGEDYLTSCVVVKASSVDTFLWSYTVECFLLWLFIHYFAIWQSYISCSNPKWKL